MKLGRAGRRSPRTYFLLAMVTPLVLLNSGCFIFGGRAKPQPPTVVINQPIILSAPAVSQPSPAPPTPPAPVLVIPPGPMVSPRHDQPVRRHPKERNHVYHRRTPVNHSTSDAPARSANAGNLPLLTPGLSPAQENAYRDSTVRLLTEARQDLNVLNGRNLSADQVATRTQASEWVRQAQIALNQGDVIRAQNLARKAAVLTHALSEQTR